MAVITITPASVVKGANAGVNKDYVFGEAVTAGQCVYLKASDSRWWLAQCDGTAAESGVGSQVGVALNGGAAGQPAAVQQSGTLTIGGTVVAATVYIVAATAGGIAPVADIASTNYLTVLGYATTTGDIQVLPVITSVQKA